MHRPSMAALIDVDPKMTNGATISIKKLVFFSNTSHGKWTSLHSATDKELFWGAPRSTAFTGVLCLKSTKAMYVTDLGCKPGM